MFWKCGPDPGSVEEEIGEIQASPDLQHHRLEKPCFCRKYLKPTLLPLAIAAFNLLSAMDALICRPLNP